VLEPVLVKSTEKRSRFPPIRSGKTEFFRDFDEFYIPTECMGMNVFNTSIAVSSQKGFEILSLDRKQSASIPSDIDAPHAAAIAQRLQGTKPLGMFRLNDQEFLLAFELCAVYVNKQGDISRSVIMEYVGKAQAAAVYGPYVLLFDRDFVEVRNAMNGRLRQVIAGRDVRCLDAGTNGGSAAPGATRTIKVAMAHPEVDRCQIVVEFVLNEGLRE
jgi:CNH domain